jgi:hypothetical protein
MRTRPQTQADYLRMSETKDTLPDELLLPCPFCGGTAGDVALSRGHGFIIGCSACQGQQFALTRAEAVKLWNARHITPEQIVYNVAQRDPGFRKHLIKQLTAMGKTGYCWKCAEQFPMSDLIEDDNQYIKDETDPKDKNYQCRPCAEADE